MRSWPFEGVVEVPVPPYATPILVPFQVPAAIVPKDELPVTFKVPPTARLPVVVAVPAVRLDMLAVVAVAVV